MYFILLNPPSFLSDTEANNRPGSPTMRSMFPQLVGSGHLAVTKSMASLRVGSKCFYEVKN